MVAQVSVSDHAVGCSGNQHGGGVDTGATTHGNGHGNKSRSDRSGTKEDIASAKLDGEAGGAADRTADQHAIYVPITEV